MKTKTASQLDTEIAEVEALVSKLMAANAPKASMRRLLKPRAK